MNLALRCCKWPALVAVLLAACSPKQDAAAGRFLYVVNCDARVDKLDTKEGKQLATIDLASRSGNPPAIPAADSEPGAIDGCLAQGAQLDAVTREVSLIAPKQARLGSEGTRDFQLLSFSVPDWKFVQARTAGNGLADPPLLQRDAAGSLRVLRADQWAPRTRLDLRDYAAAGDYSGNQIIESSGAVSLLRLFGADPARLLLALADEKARSLKPLAELPSTTARNVHLAPGGGFVLVELTEPTSTPARRTGALRLYDANGKPLRDIQDAAIGALAFVALTPAGTAVYRRNGEYRFVVLGPRFGNDPVTKPVPAEAPGLLFADQ